VFEEPIDDAAHRDVLAQPFDPGPQATNRGQSNRSARPLPTRGKGFNDLPLGQRIDFYNDAGGQPAAGVLSLAFDQLQQPFVQFERGDDHSDHGLKLADAGKQIEKLVASSRNSGRQVSNPMSVYNFAVVGL
jgi:hypothetical protein